MFKGKTRFGVDVQHAQFLPERPVEKPWFLVANRSGARIYEKKDGRISLVAEVLNPLGRAKGSQLMTDKPGRAFESRRKAAGKGVMRHAMLNEVDPVESFVLAFVNKIVQRVEKARAENGLTALFVVADPSMVGHLKKSFKPATQRLIVKTYEKDIGWLSPRAQIEKLAAWLKAF